MTFKLHFSTLFLRVPYYGNNSALKYLKSKDAQTLDAWPSRQLNFLSWCLIFVGPQYRSCFMSPSQQLEFWKIGGPTLSDEILSCQKNYIYCITMTTGALYMEYKFSLSIQFFSWS